MRRQKLRAAMALMVSRDNAARDVAPPLGVSLYTLHASVDAKGELRKRASELLEQKTRRPSRAAKAP